MEANRPRKTILKPPTAGKGWRQSKSRSCATVGNHYRLRRRRKCGKSLNDGAACQPRRRPRRARTLSVGNNSRRRLASACANEWRNYRLKNNARCERSFVSVNSVKQKNEELFDDLRDPFKNRAKR